MKRLFDARSNLVGRQFLLANTLLGMSVFVLALRLWHLQVYRGETYRRLSENNRMRRIEIPAPRGMIYDRNGQIVLGNRPYYDLVYIPQYAKNSDQTFAVLARLLHVPVEELQSRWRQSQGRPKFQPAIIKRNLSLHQVSTIESNKIFLPGVDVAGAPRRDYREHAPPHLVGYLAEIDGRELKRHSDSTHPDPYVPGDIIGKQGLESRWESYLRGQRGYSLIQVDAFGRRAARSALTPFLDVQERKAIPGHDLNLTLDLELQQTVREAFAGKTGAVVVLDPRSGKILSLLSEPQFDPEKYQAGFSRDEWRALVTNPFHPLLDKTTGGEYPPGSVYKAVVALAALQEQVITPETTVHCPGSMTLGDQVFHCHHRNGHGTVNLEHALLKSCDVFFYQVGIELGVDRLARYARALGLGQRLGVQINAERPGLVPTSAWKLATHGSPWTKGETPLVAIGQGFDLVTPIQMASLYATLGNGGKVWRPYVVDTVTSPMGSVIVRNEPTLLREVTEIAPEVFAQVRRGLRAVVEHPEGTGRRAAVPGQTVAGKTGSVQVVSLKKANVDSKDMSMKWREHAMFVAFSPVESPEVVVAVLSEHDRVGGGGAVAAPVAGAILRKYWDLVEKRRQRERSTTFDVSRK